MTPREQEIIEATKEFALNNKQYYDEGTESMILNAMRSIVLLQKGKKLCDCPECGAEIQFGLSDDTKESFKKSKLFNNPRTTD
jgi:hypothetical protein